MIRRARVPSHRLLRLDTIEEWVELGERSLPLFMQACCKFITGNYSKLAGVDFRTFTKGRILLTLLAERNLAVKHARMLTEYHRKLGPSRSGSAATALWSALLPDKELAELLQPDNAA